MEVALIIKPDHSDTGVARYVNRLRGELLKLGHQVTVVVPVVPLPLWLLAILKRWPGWDLEAFFYNYPVWIRYPKGKDIYHLTSQNLATLMIFSPPPGKTIITAHDIIPSLTEGDLELDMYHNVLHKYFDRLSNIGLRRAKRIICVSSYTRDTLVDKLGIAKETLDVVVEGV